ACVGLNVNSTAVIIGAMLISPLMGPIIGMGYSLATYDFSLLKKSASNFGFAVASGLITSTLYFLVTPINRSEERRVGKDCISRDWSSDVCSSDLACVGLNVNSTAVIIGAMLISPLMGPIIGMGYSLATYDFSLLKKSASNFGFAVASGLITSTLYFLVTPIN